MCRHTSNHYELCDHDSQPFLEFCEYSKRDRTSEEMENCLYDLLMPPRINSMNQQCPDCMHRLQLAALAAAKFWERMEQGRQDAQRRAKDEKREAKESKGNFLWRKLTRRDRKN
ncbi:hypothetical protein MMC22_006654 [Lobaria immixta]|nr:hypothetical protein [Lobaria immixta]